MYAVRYSKQQKCEIGLQRSIKRNVSAQTGLNIYNETGREPTLIVFLRRMTVSMAVCFGQHWAAAVNNHVMLTVRGYILH